jgi:hypothetical protein
MRTLLALIFLCCVSLVCKAAETSSASSEGSVWYWQSKGDGQKMKLEVQLQSKTIFTTTFSVAQASRSAIPKKSYARKIRFSFKPEQSIVWKGYRDEDFVSPAKQRIECDIWMASADSNMVILGVSFARPDTILMNTVHLASPTTEARSEITDGLVVVTSLVEDKKQNKSQQAGAGSLR